MSLDGLVRNPEGGVNLTPFGDEEIRSSDATWAAAEEAFFQNPTIGLYRRMQAETAGGRLLTHQEARARLKAAGQEFSIPIPETGIPEGTLDIMIQRKHDRQIRLDKIANAPSGIGQSAKQLSAELGASLLDPLNIGSAFIPVIGEARYTAMLARAGSLAGRTGIRVGVGAVEGAVGTALLEPIVASNMQAEYEDYTMADSLRNIAFGSVMGGGLHAVAGGIADIRRLRSGEELWKQIQGEPIREGLQAESLQPEAPNVDVPRGPDITDFIDLSPSIRTAADIAGFQRASFRSIAERELIPEIRAELLADTSRAADPGIVASAKQQIASLESRISEIEAPEAFKEKAKEFQGAGYKRKPAEAAARKSIEDELADSKAKLERARTIVEANRTQGQRELSALDRGEIPERFKDRIEARAQMLGALDRPVPALVKIDNAGPDAKMSAFRAAIAQALEGKQIDVGSIISHDPDGVMRAAKRQLSTESDALYDPSLKRAEPEVKNDMASAEFLLKEAEDMLGENVEDTIIEAANRYGKAAKALAACIGIT